MKDTIYYSNKMKKKKALFKFIQISFAIMESSHDTPIKNLDGISLEDSILNSFNGIDLSESSLLNNFSAGTSNDS